MLSGSLGATHKPSQDATNRADRMIATSTHVAARSGRQHLIIGLHHMPRERATNRADRMGRDAYRVAWQDVAAYLAMRRDARICQVHATHAAILDAVPTPPATLRAERKADLARYLARALAAPVPTQRSASNTLATIERDVPPQGTTSTDE